MAIEIIDAGDQSVREAVFRFRDEIYVREMRRRRKDADHDRCRVEDALDRGCLLLAARESASGRIVGTARALFARGAAPGVTTGYIDCNEPLVPFFQRLGDQSLRTIEHPDYGIVRLMRLDVTGAGYLSRAS